MRSLRPRYLLSLHVYLDPLMIRLATTADAVMIATIYNHYVSSSTITFEEHVVGIDEMAQRIASVGAQLPWYVFERDGEIVGYAYVFRYG